MEKIKKSKKKQVKGRERYQIETRVGGEDLDFGENQGSMPLLPLREILPDIRLGADVGRVCSLIICNNRPLNRCKPNRSTRIKTRIYAQTMKGERSEGVDGEGFDEFAQPIRHSEFLKKAILLPVFTLATRLRGLLLRRSFPSRERPHAVRRRNSTICGEPCEASSF